MSSLEGRNLAIYILRPVSPLATHSGSKYIGWTQILLVDFDFWPDYPRGGRKYLTRLGEVSTTKLFLGKVCFLGVETQVS